MELKLKELVELLGTRVTESMEVYDEQQDLRNPVCVGGCGEYGDRVVDQIIPGVHCMPRSVTAYLAVWLRKPDGPEYWDGE